MQNEVKPAPLYLGLAVNRLYCFSLSHGLWRLYRLREGCSSRWSQDTDRVNHHRESEQESLAPLNTSTAFNATYSTRSIVAGSIRSARITGRSAAKTAPATMASAGIASICKSVACT
jgi:hypothetical protein